MLPFVELGESGRDFLCDAIVSEITLALSQMREFFVIARQSSFAYKDRCVDAREAGAALGARYILDGVLQRSGRQLRLNIQLVDTSIGTVTMAQSFESDEDDILHMQVKIAQQVAGVILPSVRRQEIAAIQRMAPQELNAYGLVLSAFPKFWAHERDENLEAIRLFSDAINREPNFALAHGLKAWCHAQNTCYIWTDDPVAERAVALDHARTAAACRENDATALTAIGATYSMVTNDRTLARHFIDRSLAIDPCNAWAWMRDGWLRVLGNDPRTALDSFRKSEELSPLDPFLFNVYFGQALAWSLLGEVERAIELVCRGLKHGPAVNWAYRMLASFYAQAEDRDGMLRSLTRFREHYPGVTIAQLTASLPPIMVESNPSYMDMLRRAGIPEGRGPVGS
ncbi:MAG: hypothetical protein OXH76_11210 [Boseongicola sp.]|nr:hypothetical protein [Boseongicola sp.]